MIHEEIESCDLIRLTHAFANQPGTLLLDSARLQPGMGRFSFLGVDPFQILSSKNHQVFLNDQCVGSDPFQVLQEELSKFQQEKISERPPFQGGVGGFFSYDLRHHLERLPRKERDDFDFPDLYVGFYDLVVGVDQETKQAFIMSTGDPVQDPHKKKQRAIQRLQWLKHRIANTPSLPPISKAVIRPEQIESNFNSDTYSQAVQKVIERILAGDLFEVNISQRFHAPLPQTLSAFDLYRRLTQFNPAPFAAYIQAGDTQIVSASPERFLRLSGDRVETRPIKGTRPRHMNPAEDQRLAEELLNSEKDRAENVMIVDLMRNDLSRVCRPHTVHVPQLCQIESFATVHHLVSSVQGQLKVAHNALDLLRASFPGGSITGAPKIQSMELIADIEPTLRGPYCGSVGYIGFNGDMDTSITIRTFAIKDQRVIFQTGGAIVLDSDPKAEYQETLDKARALKRTLTQCV